MTYFLNTRNHLRNPLIEQDWSPACDILEEAEHYLMTFEMPGVPRDQIKIECHNNQVSLSGERRPEAKSDSSSAWYSERNFGKFHRSFTLPSGVNTEKVEANYQDGMLRLYIPKSESAKPRQIKIS